MSFYETLGIPNNATIQDAKNAYRELAKKHHPDTKDGDANRFREISEAYEHLGNETKKHKYDTAMSMSNGMGDDFLEAFRNSTDFASMFDGVFGTRAKGPDIRISIQLTLFDVYYGAEKLIFRAN
jgi:molecular chaperone DnaJ